MQHQSQNLQNFEAEKSLLMSTKTNLELEIDELYRELKTKDEEK